VCESGNSTLPQPTISPKELEIKKKIQLARIFVYVYFFTCGEVQWLRLN
jgi:hypothetical protein